MAFIKLGTVSGIHLTSAAAGTSPPLSMPTTNLRLKHLGTGYDRAETDALLWHVTGLLQAGQYDVSILTKLISYEISETGQGKRYHCDDVDDYLDTVCTAIKTALNAATWAKNEPNDPAGR